MRVLKYKHVDVSITVAGALLAATVELCETGDGEVLHCYWVFDGTRHTPSDETTDRLLAVAIQYAADRPDFWNHP